MHRNLKIQLIAPSGYPHDQVASQRGISRLEAAGHTVSGKACLHRMHQRFAGTVEERTAEINAFADPAQPLPDLALAVRGGYGAHQLLANLHYDALRERLGGQPFVLVGHSDVNVLQLALLARAGIVTLAGPMLSADFGAETLRDFTWRHFWNTACQARTEANWSVDDESPDVSVEGVLWGGNLAVMCALVGTPYLPAIEQGILFVEDVAEAPFRVERMLYHLHLAGILQKQRALVLGNFSSYRISEYDNGYDLPEAVERIRKVTGIPVITDMPFGHTPDKITLPMGGQARLVVHGGEASLTCWNYPHLG
jgi:muramoyltetrapeptide carboxypeptidase